MIRRQFKALRQLESQENNPYALSLLQSSLKLEGLETYNVFLLVQVCILCGASV